MASFKSQSIRQVEPERPNPFSESSDVTIPPDGTPPIQMENGARKINNADGSVTIDLNPGTFKDVADEGKFYDNLADKIDDAELSRIAGELISDIESDDRSRQEWLETRARGIKLLGLKIEEPRGDVGTSSAPLEGMSTVRHPALLEATLRFQATARGELLPAEGPAKVRNDTPIPPKAPPPAPEAPPQPGMPGPMPGAAPGMPAPGSPPALPAPAPTGMMTPPQPVTPDGEMQASDELATALETDMNHYLTDTASEYYPDTDRMLFWIGAGGQGIKKVYNCPLRRRPVSESVDAEDIIVSNAAVSLESCGRITHKIRMRPSTLKRMQIVGAYREVDLPAAPQYRTETAPEIAKHDIQGTQPAQPARPTDADYELYECHCELEITGFEHKGKNGKPTGLRLPWVITLDKNSRQILQVRRNWKKNDDLCMPKEYFVDFPFVRALGFYGIGLIHIVGNTAMALTAAWREMLDAGMYANFPGFIYSKIAGRQLTNQFRVPPGGGIGIETGGNPLNQLVMPLPYKEPGAAFTAFIAHIEEVAQRVAGVADIQIGEGRADVPVGTTLAMIEQASKTMDAVHKRLHAAQAKEFKLLIERFREDPEAFWRHNKKPAVQWQKEQFIQAINNNSIVPVADPNNPTSLHRIAKATVIKTLQQSSPALYDPIAVDTRIMRIAGIDPTGLFRAVPQQQPPDPRLLAVQAKAQAEQMSAEVAKLEAQIKAAQLQATMQDAAAQRQSDMQLEQMKIERDKMQIVKEWLIHQSDMASQQDRTMMQETAKHYMAGTQMHMDHTKHFATLDHEREKQRELLDHQKEIERIRASRPQGKTAK